MEPERKLFPRSCTIKHRPFSVDCRMKLRGQERYLKSRLLSLSPMYIQKMCIYIYIYLHTYVCVCTCVYTYTCTSICKYVYI